MTDESKVFCQNCRWLEKGALAHWCRCVPAAKDTYFAPNYIAREFCQRRNKNNNCEFFAPKPTLSETLIPNYLRRQQRTYLLSMIFCWAVSLAAIFFAGYTIYSALCGGR